MFDREGFIDYVGAKSGNSYASGLARIENLYSVGIDAEYDKDKCEALLTQIEVDKKRTDLDQKELKKRSDAASHLKRYITFKTNSIDTITDRIHFVIDHYKEHFDAVDQGERYKWEAIAWYKKHWEIDSPNFAQMLEEAFGKAKNLLASAMYYPYRRRFGIPPTQRGSLLGYDTSIHGRSRNSQALAVLGWEKGSCFRSGHLCPEPPPKNEALYGL